MFPYAGLPAASYGELSPAIDPMDPNLPIEQPKNVFRYGEQSLWSTALFPGGSIVAGTENYLFATPMNDNGQGFTNPLSAAETNILLGGRIPNGVAYDVFGLSASFYKATGVADAGDIGAAVDTEALVTELVSVGYNVVLSWAFTQTFIDIAPFDLVGAGGGAFGSVSTTQNATQVGHMNNGAGGIWLYRAHPVALPGTTQFNILARFGTRAPPIGTNSTALRVSLFGFYKNVIEIA